MKIGIDCRLWNESGVGRYIRNLVAYLEQQDTKNQYVLFILSKDYEDVKKHVEKANFILIKADFRWHSFAEQLFFPGILYGQKLDLVHFPYFSFPLLYIKPFVITIHDMIMWQFATGKASTLPQFFYWIKQFVYRFVVFWGALRARKIITVSEATKKEIMRYLHVNSSKIEVTYEGVDSLKEGILDKEILQKISNDFFLTVGNTYPHKNLEKLVDAFQNFSNKKMSLIIVGKENYFVKKLQQYVREKQVDNVYFTGFVSDATLAVLYNKTKATIIPSLMEGFGLPALEAMSHESMIAVSDIPVFHEICKDAAFYFDPNNESDIFNTLEKVLTLTKKEQENRKKIGSDYAKKFSWKEMVAKTQKIYESCFGI